MGLERGSWIIERPGVDLELAWKNGRGEWWCVVWNGFGGERNCRNLKGRLEQVAMCGIVVSTVAGHLLWPERISWHTWSGL